MAYIRRSLEAVLFRALATFPAALVTGPRQTGKTTLLRATFGKNHEYVSLERPDVRSRALSDPLAFFEDHPPPVILDEIQLAPELLHYIKDAIDEDRRPGRWLLTGSQSLALMRNVSQTLAGRLAVFTLDPFGPRELSGARPRTVDAALEALLESAPKRATTKEGSRPPDLSSWLLRGGFPELRTKSSVDRRLWLGSYVQTYLERDVRDLLAVGDLEAFRRCLALLAARSGTILNLADLGRDVGVSAPTIRSWISVLEASHLVARVQPHFANFGKRLVKSPKGYLLDPALATFLTGVHDREAALHGPNSGALFEGLVFSQLRRLFHQAGEAAPIYYFRSSSGDEVDFVTERNGRLIGIECKLTATPTPAHAAALSKWLSWAGPAARGLLVCNVKAPLTVSPNVRAVPWWMLG